MRYVKARAETAQRELAYRIFLTDALRSIAKNTATAANGGEYPKDRFITVLRNLDKPEETRTSEEIIEGIRSKLRRLSNG